MDNTVVAASPAACVGGVAAGAVGMTAICGVFLAPILLGSIIGGAIGNVIDGAENDGKNPCCK